MPAYEIYSQANEEYQRADKAVVFTLPGYEAFTFITHVHTCGDGYGATDAGSGLSLNSAWAATREQAIEQARERLVKVKYEIVVRTLLAAKACRDRGEKPKAYKPTAEERVRA